LGRKNTGGGRFARFSRHLERNDGSPEPGVLVRGWLADGAGTVTAVGVALGRWRTSSEAETATTIGTTATGSLAVAVAGAVTGGCCLLTTFAGTFEPAEAVSRRLVKIARTGRRGSHVVDDLGDTDNPSGARDPPAVAFGLLFRSASCAG
jgi:hypothetical protein